MSRKPILFPIKGGVYSTQAHVNVPEGTFEEEYGREGFFGQAAHFYRKHPPTDWTHIEGPCKPRAFDLNKMTLSGWAQQKLLYNSSVTISMVNSQGGDPWYQRNADGDEIHFVHEGEGILESDFGALKYKKGDYVYIPRALTYRFLSSVGNKRLVVESTGGIFSQPDRGLMGVHALYDPAVLVLPEIGPSATGPTDNKNKLWTVKVKRQNQITSISYNHNPLDVVGFKGDISVFSLSIKDIRPVMSHRAHLAPSVHSTFVADGFVICTFVPRPLEEEKGAQRVPFFHRNVDFDEFIFYHEGDFFSRDHIRPGWMTFHPTGIHHGPHPKALENQFKKERTDEYAVMVDTRHPLIVAEDAEMGACEWLDYWKSWQKK